MPKTIKQPPTRVGTKCLQLSVDVERWSDARLTSFFPGRKLGDVRLKLRQMKRDGYTAVPCNAHRCDERGECSGVLA